MTNERSDTRFILRFYERVFRKLVEDLIEAYHRTPLYISSRPYIERALNLALAGLDASRMFMEQWCVGGKTAKPNEHGGSRPGAEGV